MSAEALPFGLMAMAFALGIMTCLAVIAAGRSLKARKKYIPSAKPLGAGGMGQAILAAVRSGALQLHYQPKVDCRTMKLCGAEALSRWTLPDGTLLPAEEFVARAEAVGGIAELTFWGVQQTLEDSEKLDSKSLGGPILVNLSVNLIKIDFVSKLIAMIGSKAPKIGFEITETAVLDNPDEALICLHMLRDAGVRLAIDDYGAGLSSLSYLKQIPANELKIDRKFIHGMTTSNRDPLIVRSTIDLCHGLGMTVTAEGVEDAMTASLLRMMGCDTIQGYLISKAVPIGELQKFVANHPGAVPQVRQIRKIAGRTGTD